MIKLEATGLPESIEQYQLALNAAFASGEVAGAAQVKNWKPIETAPKNRRILLGFSKPVFTGVSAIFGKWDNEPFVSKPRPHWTHDMYRLCGMASVRANQPNFWMDATEVPTN